MKQSRQAQRTTPQPDTTPAREGRPSNATSPSSSSSRNQGNVWAPARSQGFDAELSESRDAVGFRPQPDLADAPRRVACSSDLPIVEVDRDGVLSHNQPR